VQAGFSFANGYAIGISAGQGAVAAAARKLALKALAAVKNAQLSASPSKKTKELGNFFGEGYEVGIAESMKGAVETARRMTGEILNASVLSSSGAGVIRVEAGNEPLTVTAENARQPVYLNGRKIAEIQGFNNSTSLAKFNNKHVRGVGGK
jgi:hypothetical protein